VRSEGLWSPCFCKTLILVVVHTLLATAALQSQTLDVLHGFNNSPDGSQPWSGIAKDAGGNLYGTTTHGGDFGFGMVFKLVHVRSGWISYPLYNFPDPGQGQDGAMPHAPATIGHDGSVYGTTPAGGLGFGVVFKLTPPPTVCHTTICLWRETILYRFTGGDDGGQPYAPVILDSAGNIYGTTQGGGTAGLGTVFKLTPSGGGWTETVLHSFTDLPDGAQPETGLVFDSTGKLYGTTSGGGLFDSGTVFQLTPSGGVWTETILHNFSGDDGYAPYGGLIFDHAGNLYGTTTYSLIGNGTVFELSPAGGGQWNFSTLYYLLSGDPTVPGPVGALLLDGSGNLYGTTFQGGVPGCGYGNGCGTVFKLSPGGGGWNYNLLYQFAGADDGGFPVDGLVTDSQGVLYGSGWGGNSGNGVVFQWTP
jgi:uncharacterized repeat protein (TIGR03803 family)